MRDASTAQVCRQPPRLIALPLPHAPMLTPAMPCGSHPNRPPAPSIVLPPQLTISRAARRWLPRRRLLRRQLRLPRIRPGALLALVRHLSSTAAARRNAARRGGRRPRLPPAAVPHTDSAAARMPAQATSTAPPQPAWLRLHGGTSPELDYRHHEMSSIPKRGVPNTDIYRFPSPDFPLNFA
jgi:hypothetical protein